MTESVGFNTIVLSIIMSVLVERADDCRTLRRRKSDRGLYIVSVV